MEFSAQQIAMLLGGKITGDANRKVWDVGSIESRPKKLFAILIGGTMEMFRVCPGCKASDEPFDTDFVISTSEDESTLLFAREGTASRTTAS